MKQIYSVRSSTNELTLAASYKYEELEWLSFAGEKIRREHKPIGFFHIIIDGFFFGNRSFRYDIYEVLDACSKDFFNPNNSNHSPSLFLVSSKKIMSDYSDWLIDRDIREHPDEYVLEEYDVLTDSDFFSKYAIFENHADELLYLKLGFPGYTQFLDGNSTFRLIYFWFENQEKIIASQSGVIKEGVFPLGTCKKLADNLLVQLIQPVTHISESVMWGKPNPKD